MFNLDEAIKHCEEVAEENYGKATEYQNQCNELSKCLKCGDEHMQLAEWLKDYKRLKEQESKTGHWIALEEWKKDFKGFINELSMPKDDYNGIMEYIDEVPNESKWIPVSERLPETDDEVLATDGVDMFVAWYSRKDMWQGWMSSDNNFERNTPIVAWMPLPRAYREVEE